MWKQIAIQYFPTTNFTRECKQSRKQWKSLLVTLRFWWGNVPSRNPTNCFLEQTLKIWEKITQSRKRLDPGQGHTHWSNIWNVRVTNEVNGPISTIRSIPAMCMWYMCKVSLKGFMPICGENMAKVEESKPLHQICAKQENSKCTRSVTTLTKLATVCSLNVSHRKLTKSIKCIVNKFTVSSLKLEP